MKTLKKPAVISPVLLSLSLLWSTLVFGQSTTGGLHAIGGYVGFTERNNADFTFGFEYGYRIYDQWSAGAIVEHTSDYFMGRDATLVLATGNFRPAGIPQLKMTGGTGVEFKSAGSNDIRFRVGAGYDLIRGLISVTPRIGVDFGSGGENIVVGVTFFYGL